MNNRQLDMVLGYLNEGIGIDSDLWLYESVLLESNKDVREAMDKHEAILKQLGSEYKKAAKAKDAEWLNKVYNKIDHELAEYEKEINTVKITKGDTAVSIATLLALYAFLGFMLKTPTINLIHGVSKGILAGSVIVGKVSKVNQAIKDIKANGANTETLNTYKNTAKANAAMIRAYYKKVHKKNLEKIKENK